MTSYTKFPKLSSLDKDHLSSYDPETGILSVLKILHVSPVFDHRDCFLSAYSNFRFRVSPTDFETKTFNFSGSGLKILSNGVVNISELNSLCIFVPYLYTNYFNANIAEIGSQYNKWGEINVDKLNAFEVNIREGLYVEDATLGEFASDYGIIHNTLEVGKISNGPEGNELSSYAISTDGTISVSPPSYSGLSVNGYDILSVLGALFLSVSYLADRINHIEQSISNNN